MQYAFTCVEDFLRHNGHEQYIKNLIEWRELYSRIWTEKIQNAELPDKDRRTLEDFLMKALAADKLQLPTAEDNYYYEQADFLEE